VVCLLDLYKESGLVQVMRNFDKTERIGEDWKAAVLVRKVIKDREEEVELEANNWITVITMILLPIASDNKKQDCYEET
jgi:hypothetical protein